MMFPTRSLLVSALALGMANLACKDHKETSKIFRIDPNLKTLVSDVQPSRNSWGGLIITAKVALPEGTIVRTIVAPESNLSDFLGHDSKVENGAIKAGIFMSGDKPLSQGKYVLNIRASFNAKSQTREVLKQTGEFGANLPRAALIKGGQSGDPQSMEYRNSFQLPYETFNGAPFFFFKDELFKKYQPAELKTPDRESTEFVKMFSHSYNDAIMAIEDQVESLSNPELRRLQRETLQGKISVNDHRKDADHYYAEACKAHIKERSEYFDKHQEGWFKFGVFRYYHLGDGKVEIKFMRDPEFTGSSTEYDTVGLPIQDVDILLFQFKQIAYSGIKHDADKEFGIQKYNYDNLRKYIEAAGRYVSAPDGNACWEKAESSARQSHLILVARGSFPSHVIKELAIAETYSGSILKPLYDPGLVNALNRSIKRP